MPDLVPVSLVQHQVAVPDIMAAARGLIGAFGQRDVFVLESMAGPATDSRESLLGLTGLLDVAVRRSRVTVTGVPALVERIEAALLRAGAVVRDADGLVLTAPASCWDVPRLVERAFDVVGTAEEFRAGLFAFYGYDAVHYVEDLPRRIPDPPSPSPDVHFSLVRAVVKVPSGGERAAVFVLDSPLWPTLDMDEVVAALSAPADGRRTQPVPAPRAVVDDVEPEVFGRRVETALAHIAAGDIYQIQLGHQIRVETDVDPLVVYERLRERNPSPYMTMATVGASTVVAASPELFVRVEGREVTMRPIAGTVARAGTAEGDARAAERLLADPKERAEHIMLVDLCRNDFGRVCVAGTLDVTDLMITERYSHVLHLVSNVVARLRDGVDAYDVVQACFPAGTMTGAPKIRAMEIIEDLESSRRGLYAGAHGLIGFGGWSVLALSIRMVVHDGEAYALRASAGVVADSTPQGEWHETLAKMGAAFWAVTGTELS